MQLYLHALSSPGLGHFAKSAPLGEPCSLQINEPPLSGDAQHRILAKVPNNMVFQHVMSWSKAQSDAKTTGMVHVQTEKCPCSFQEAAVVWSGCTGLLDSQKRYDQFAVLIRNKKGVNEPLCALTHHYGIMTIHH